MIESQKVIDWLEKQDHEMLVGFLVWEYNEDDLVKEMKDLGVSE